MPVALTTACLSPMLPTGTEERDGPGGRLQEWEWRMSNDELRRSGRTSYEFEAGEGAGGFQISGDEAEFEG